MYDLLRSMHWYAGTVEGIHALTHGGTVTRTSRLLAHHSGEKKSHKKLTKMLQIISSSNDLVASSTLAIKNMGKQNKNTGKYGKTKQKWGVLPVGAKALSPVKKPKARKNKNKKILQLALEGRQTHTVYKRSRIRGAVCPGPCTHLARAVCGFKPRLRLSYYWLIVILSEVSWHKPRNLNEKSLTLPRCWGFKLTGL